MQFLWKYIDELAGKGIEWYIMAELLFYASAHLVPMALPLAVLLASIMLFGNLGESLELTAVKSSGISLIKFMQPLFGVILTIGALGFYFSNNILPIANMKFGALLYDLREQKPALQIKPGVFYYGIDGYVIKVGAKSADNQSLLDVTIWDHTENKGNKHVITAKKGEIFLTSDKHFMVFKLYDGYSYEELQQDNNKQYQPLLTTTFKTQQVNFDLASFKLSRTDASMFKDGSAMLSLGQLDKSIDSLERAKNSRIEEVHKFMNSFTLLGRDSNYYMIKPDFSAVSAKPVDNLIQADNSNMIISDILNTISNQNGYTDMVKRNVSGIAENISRNGIEWHRKFTLSASCLLLFIIGASLGALIRKGGLGIPLFVAIIFFVIYYIFSMSMEKSAKEGVLSPLWGMWLPLLVMLPLGMYLLYSSNTDSKLLNVDFYKRLLKKTKITK